MCDSCVRHDLEFVNSLLDAFCPHHPKLNTTWKYNNVPRHLGYENWGCGCKDLAIRLLAEYKYRKELQHG